MNAAQLLHTIAGAVTLGLGLLGLLRPSAAAAFTSIEPKGLLGVSEIRATYGGLFVAMGGYCLLTGAPSALALAGFAWLGAAAGRVLSVLVDGNRAPKNLGGVLFEGLIGGLFLAP